MMNDLLAPIYESFFDWPTYGNLLRAVFDQIDFGKFGWLLLIVPALLLFLFYKVWDPVSRPQRIKYFLVLVLIFVIIFSSVTGILYSNNEIQVLIGNYTSASSEPNPEWFIMQMSFISVLLSVFMSVIYTLIIKRFSTNNSHNPF